MKQTVPEKTRIFIFAGRASCMVVQKKTTSIKVCLKLNNCVSFPGIASVETG